MHFPFVFQVMFVLYIALGVGVFILLDAPPMPALSGGVALVGVIVFYFVISLVFVAGGAILPQYDPNVEKEFILLIIKEVKLLTVHQDYFVRR